MTDAQATNARRIVAAVRARGSDAEDLRDAAHEAVHGLLGDLASWNRSAIHYNLAERLGPGDRVGLLSEEITARAVEAIVCERLGVKHDLAACALVTLMEADSIGFYISWSPAEFADAVRLRLPTAETQALADRVIALGDEP